MYEYDGASQRVRIKELESSVETKNERLAWCGGRICQKRASKGTTVVRSYFGNGFEESGPTKYFYTRDHLGSVREVVESDGTTVASRLSYDPWGKITETGSGALSDFTYTGHHYDRSMGLNLARYRAYDPNLGRWLSQDPIGLWGGWNLYGYVGNDPIWYVDPEGRCAVAAAPAVGAWARAALALWGAWDCAVNGCRGIKALVDIGYQAVIDVTKDKDIPFRGGSRGGPLSSCVGSLPSSGRPQSCE